MESRTDVFGQGLYSEVATAGAEASVDLDAPGESRAWVIDQVDFGYSAAPAAAEELVISISGVDCWRVPVTVAGVQTWKPNMAVMGDRNGGVSVSLTAGGGVEVAYLNVFAHQKELK